MNYDLTRLGISALNAMQQDALQTIRKGASVVLLSPTGSGKTLAYLLPLLQKLDAQNDNLQALIIVPSRELAIQTTDVARRLCSELRAAACYGGRPAMEEHQQLRGLRPHLVVATPGRLLDHLQKGNLLPEDVRILVLDEFDKLLELGFREQMHDIIALLPDLQQRILLSATDADEIPAFVGSDKHIRLSFLDEEESDARISLRLVKSPEKDKLQSLLRLLCTLGTQKSLVFVGYRESVERVGNYLEQNGLMAGILHGGMEQRDRERALYRFLNSSGPEEELPEFVAADEVETYALPARVPAPSKPLWITLYIGKGKKDKISRGDIVGFLTKQGGLESNQVGRIDVLPHWSYVAVERAASRELLQRIKGLKIKGQKTIYAVAGS